MLTTRVIPCLLKRHKALVKTIKFNKFNYIGDPVNTLQIFNNLMVDEIVVLDILATLEGKKPDFDFIKDIASECFMPLAYGGGIKTLEEIKKIFSLGVEKVIICSAAVENPQLIREASQAFGGQSIVVSIDVKKNIWGRYEVKTFSGRKKTGLDPVDFAKKAVELGAGEILLNSIDRDGTMSGYDLDLIKKISKTINVPLVAVGGAGEYSDLNRPIKSGASAVAAGSLFVYQRKNYESVLVNYPTPIELSKIFRGRR